MVNVGASLNDQMGMVEDFKKMELNFKFNYHGYLLCLFIVGKCQIIMNNQGFQKVCRKELVGM